MLDTIAPSAANDIPIVCRPWGPSDVIVNTVSAKRVVQNAAECSLRILSLECGSCHQRLQRESRVRQHPLRGSRTRTVFRRGRLRTGRCLRRGLRARTRGHLCTPAGPYGPDGGGAPTGRAMWPTDGYAGSADPRAGSGAYWLGVGRRCSCGCVGNCGGDIMCDGGRMVDGGRGGAGWMHCPGCGGVLRGVRRALRRVRG